MKTIKTDKAKIEIEIVSFNEQGERHVIVWTEDNQRDPTVIVLPASIVSQSSRTQRLFAILQTF